MSADVEDRRVRHPSAGSATWPTRRGASRARYGRLLATKRRKTIALTILTMVAIAYPVLYQQFLASFSRNVFPLPLPDDTDGHVHDDLRDHGHRPEHRGRVRRAAGPRLRRLLRDRRLHRGILRLTALRERQHRPVLQRRQRLPGHPPAVLDRPARPRRSSPPRSAHCWALRRFGCAATTWPS